MTKVLLAIVALILLLFCIGAYYVGQALTRNLFSIAGVEDGDDVND